MKIIIVDALKRLPTCADPTPAALSANEIVAGRAGKADIVASKLVDRNYKPQSGPMHWAPPRPLGKMLGAAAASGPAPREKRLIVPLTTGKIRRQNRIRAYLNMLFRLQQLGAA